MAEVIPNPEKKVFVTGDTRGRANCNWWQYARDVRNIARNSRVNLPTGAQLTAIVDFINTLVYWLDNEPFIPGSGLPREGVYIGTRPWLGLKLNIKAISGLGNYVGSTAVEPAYVLVKVLEHISRDMKKIPVNNAEKTAVDNLILATDPRRLGIGPLFGNVAGDKPTV